MLEKKLLWNQAIKNIGYEIVTCFSLYGFFFFNKSIMTQTICFTMLFKISSFVFCRRSHTGLERHEGEYMVTIFFFGVKNPFKCFSLYKKDLHFTSAFACAWNLKHCWMMKNCLRFSSFERWIKESERLKNNTKTINMHILFFYFVVLT